MDREDEKYRDYIEMIPVEKTHAGYFSIDRKGHVVDSKGKGKEMMSDDQDAYDLIMKNKELLLECDPKPVSCSIHFFSFSTSGRMG